LKGKIFIGVGDFRQIVPIVHSATVQDTISSCIQNSYIWQKFHVISLKINMRLERLRLQLLQQILKIDENMTIAQEQNDLLVFDMLETQKMQITLDESAQRKYANMIIQIGNGVVTNSPPEICYLTENTSSKTKTYNYKVQNCMILQDKTDTETKHEYNSRYHLKQLEAVQDFYPDGFQTHQMQDKTILAATNNQIDKWNCVVQQQNPNYSSNENDFSNTNCKTYLSSDVLNAVDDPRDIISGMLSEEMLNKYNSDKSPPHKITLCIGDICYLMRTLSRQSR